MEPRILSYIRGDTCSRFYCAVAELTPMLVRILTCMPMSQLEELEHEKSLLNDEIDRLTQVRKHWGQKRGHWQPFMLVPSYHFASRSSCKCILFSDILEMQQLLF